MDGLNQPFYGGEIDPQDHNDPRTRIVQQIDRGSNVLEVGCGSGTIIHFLQTHHQCQVIGVEPSPTMAKAARDAGLTIIEGDINDGVVLDELQARGPFDAVIFADVLEHLSNPWQTLRLIKPLLKPTGRAFASVPNVAFWRLRLNLLFGQWRYTEGHLMDHTHLRWFTRKTLQELFVDCDYQVLQLQHRWVPLPGHRLWRMIPNHLQLYARLAARWPGLFSYQFVITAARESN
ncbi:MAG: class I SAM-dependent methyltransferase [Ardenticatenaceae bacterium]|nr:class I SAM-dependent methyltransferase [Ardenticatenaceae bacterium]